VRRTILAARMLAQAFQHLVRASMRKGEAVIRHVLKLSLTILVDHIPCSCQEIPSSSK
jgi:hypothetical protein